MHNNQPTLFEPASKHPKTRPLAARMRPKTLEGIVGQEHLLGEHSLLKRLIQQGELGSILLYGPPGSGKTTLAEVIAHESGSRFVSINAVLSNVAEVRDILKMARQSDGRTVLFIDEIHRFNKSQQDLLLPDVEAGHVCLIGATTHNPRFYINAPLLSRSHLFELEAVSDEAVTDVLAKALQDTENGLGNTRCSADKEILKCIATMADGDLRRALNALETIVLSQPMGNAITQEAIDHFAAERHIRYDKNDEEHYDTISAFIKSVRGSDPDAALYWLAKMLEGGEDPRFIARRLMILASEDIGLGDSRALPLASAAFHACEVLGMPECAINLGHVTVFLATAPKSNTAYMAIKEAQAAVKNTRTQPIPMYLKNNPAMSKSEPYRYSHNYEENISGQEYMTEPMTFYKPKAVGAEAAIAERLAHWKTLKAKKKNYELGFF